MYKAKYNLSVGGTSFEQGKTYTKDQISGVDEGNFELVGGATADEVKTGEVKADEAGAEGGAEDTGATADESGKKKEDDESLEG